MLLPTRREPDGGQVVVGLAVRHSGTASATVIGGAHPDFVHSGLARSTAPSSTTSPRTRTTASCASSRPCTTIGPRCSRRPPACGWATTGSTTPHFTAISTPTPVLAADHDEVVGLDLSLDLLRRLPDAELAVVPGARHESPTSPERGPVFAALIDHFARRRAGAPR